MVDGDDPGRLDERAAAIIRAELARILASDAFRAAPQLSSFLSFVVERTIEGRTAELKGYTIAVEALGRPADFNPQIDPIVRVEAGRLRRALAQYYGGEGQDDPVQFSMPVGGYVPAFAFAGREAAPAAEAVDRVAAATPEEPRIEHPADRNTGRRWSLLAFAALATALLALAWWHLALPGRQAELASSTTTAIQTGAGVQPAAPPPHQLTRVAITIPTLPTDPKLAALLRRFANLLVDAMARFDDLVTIIAPPPGAVGSADVDYVFEMGVQVFDGGAEGFGRLRSVRDGRIVWTTSSGRPSSEALQEANLAEMARRLATRLTEPFGIISADARQVPPSPAMRCILRAFDMRRTMKPEDHLAARTCLEQMVEQDPGFYPGWAHLAILTLGEYGSGYNPKDTAPLDRSLAAALNAIRLAPSGARAHQAMMKVLLLRGSTEEAIQMGREALARNPYDPDIMADMGALLVRLGQPSEGLPLLERAIALSVGRPARYDFYAFLGAYLTGADKASETYASNLAADTSPLSLLGQALSAALENDTRKQSEMLKNLGEKAPRFAKDPREFLARKGFSEGVVTRILGTLGLGGR